MKPLGATTLTELEQATQAYQKELELAAPYLSTRAISLDTAERFRLGYVADPISGHEHYMGRLAIPTIGRDGVVFGIRFRAVDGREPKYLGIAGADTRLFNLRALFGAGDIICLTEGEIDAITLEQCGHPAIGVSGCAAWKRHHSRIFAGFRRVLVFGDADTAGREFAQRVVESMRNAVAVQLPAGEDVNSLYVARGTPGIESLFREAAE